MDHVALKEKMERLFASLEGSRDADLVTRKIDAFVRQGLDDANEAQAMLGCAILATARHWQKYNPSLAFTDVSTVKAIRDPQQDGDGWGICNETQGLKRVLQDFFRRRYGGDWLADTVTECIASRSFQPHLCDVLLEYGFNPLKGLNVAVVGGQEETCSVESFPLQNAMNHFVYFNDEERTPLWLSNAKEAAGEVKFDYIVSGNVLCSDHLFRDNARQAMADIFCACSTLLKKGGRAFHILGYMGGRAFYRLQKEGLSEFAGLEELEEGPWQGEMHVFEKQDEREIESASLDIFLRGREKEKAKPRAGFAKPENGGSVPEKRASFTSYLLGRLTRQR